MTTAFRLALLAALCGGACAPALIPGPAAPPAPAGAADPARETRALLLLLVDSQRFEPVVLAGAMRGGPALGEAAAEAMGRIGDPRARSYLAELLADPEPAVRRAAAFALGELEYPELPAGPEGAAEPPARRGPDDRVEAARALLVAAVDPDRETGRLAIEALGKIGVSVVEVLAALTADAGLAETERWARLLPPLFRFDEEATVAAAAGGLAAAGDPQLRRAAAYALSRNPRPAALPALRKLALDSDPRVRAWAARALGIVGDPAADLPRLARLLDDEDPAPAVQALRAGGVLRTVAPPAGEAASDAASAEPAAGGDAGGPAVDRATAGRWHRRLAELLADPRPHVRLAALEAAAHWLPDPALEAALAARAAGVRWDSAERAERPAEGGVGVPAGAVEEATAGGEGAPSGEPSDAVETGAGGAIPAGRPDGAMALAERAAALVALAEGRVASRSRPGAPRVDPEAAPEVVRLTDLVEAAAVSGAPRLRVAAARAAAAMDGEGHGALARLLADPDPAVRTAAYAAALGDSPDALLPVPASVAGFGVPSAPAVPGAAGAPPAATSGVQPAAALAAAALAADADPGVLAVVLGWLADHPVVGYEEIAKAAQRLLRDGGDAESALAAVRAVAARGEAESRERGGAVAVLERLTASGDWLVRRAAARGLAALGRPAPAVAPPRGRPPAVYEQIVERTAEPRTVEVVTSAGTLVIELACPAAPLTCLSFLHLAGQGFYDGLTFHRVVPDFVVQGGDPRGDGFGGPPFTLRDEINRLRYERGTVGMALAGPDTGGSQFFVTLAPQPHLDGGYTAFGRVVAGDEVLDRIVPGTAIERVREVSPPAGSAERR